MLPKMIRKTTTASARFTMKNHYGFAKIINEQRMFRILAADSKMRKRSFCSFFSSVFADRPENEKSYSMKE